MSENYPEYPEKKMGFWQSLFDMFGCKPSEKIWFNGTSYVSKCTRCGRKILQDSQGNWFPVDESWWK